MRWIHESDGGSMSQTWIHESDIGPMIGSMSQTVDP